MIKNRKSIRLKGYDYTNAGAYFITICTQDRVHYFGEVVDRNMMLNDLGKETWNCRNNIPNHYPFVETDEFICMPNHIHGILLINEHNNISNIVGQKHFFADNNPNKNIKQQIQPESGSLSSIIRGFKIGVTKFAKQNNIDFERQGRFYDHIVREDQSYQKIKNYIEKNPENWKDDCFFR